MIDELCFIPIRIFILQILLYEKADCISFCGVIVCIVARQAQRNDVFFHSQTAFGTWDEMGIRHRSMCSTSYAPLIVSFPNSVLDLLRDITGFRHFAFHNPHLDFISAIWFGVSVWIPNCFASLMIPSINTLIS